MRNILAALLVAAVLIGGVALTDDGHCAAESGIVRLLNCP